MAQAVARLIRLATDTGVLAWRPGESLEYGPYTSYDSSEAHAARGAVACSLPPEKMIPCAGSIM